MVSKMKSLLEQLKKKDRGSSIIMVIVAIAFIGMLVMMLAYMVYYNYLMKHIDKSNKDNFYSAEYALDVINAGLQQDISNSMSEAYVKAMKESANMESDVITLKFKTYFRDNLRNRIAVTGNTSLWNSAHLRQMWAGEPFAIVNTAGQTGAYLSCVPGTSCKLTEAASGDYLTINDLYIVFTNDKGFVSIIQTDIRLKVPSLDFAASANQLNLEQYSLIANTQLINDNNDIHTVPESHTINKGASTTVTGSVYGGKDGMVVANSTSMKFVKDDKDNGLDVTYSIVAKSIDEENNISTGSGIDIDNTYETYVMDINVHSSRFKGDGLMLVGDDMDISGDGSSVTLAGKYRGYGNENTTSERSSALLINGANVSLDFSGLNELVLSGHAYVGAKRYDADLDRLQYSQTEDSDNPYSVDPYTGSDKIEDKDLYDDNSKTYTRGENVTTQAAPKNTRDVLTGESVSVKANQICYLVPGECIGYDNSTNEQYITHNPMTYEEYYKLTHEQSTVRRLKESAKGKAPEDIVDSDYEEISGNKYDVCRLSVLWDKMGVGDMLHDSDYFPVFRRINGKVMVYLYLDFGSDEMTANDFFTSYYNYNSTSVDSYINSYVKSFKWNSALNSEANLTLAGNAFTINNKKVTLKDDSLDNSTKYYNMINMADDYSAAYESLMHTLRKDSSTMTSTQSMSDLFDNLIEDATLQKMADKNYSFDGNGVAADAYSAKIAAGDVFYPSCGSDTGLIVAGGDVYLSADFDGLVIAKGNIYVCEGCTKVTYNPSKVVKCMQLTYEDTVLGTTTYVYDLFGTSGKISYGVVTDNGAGETIALSDLITYQNWKKE